MRTANRRYPYQGQFFITSPLSFAGAAAGSALTGSGSGFFSSMARRENSRYWSPCVVFWVEDTRLTFMIWGLDSRPEM